MRTRILFVLLIFASVLSTQAQPGAYHKLDSWALMSDIIVLCDEKSVRFDPAEAGDWGSHQSAAVSCKIVRVFKGDLKPGAEITVRYENWQAVRFLPREFYGRVYDKEGRLVKEVKPQCAPLGRTLLFLQPESKGGHWVWTKLDAGKCYDVFFKLIETDDILGPAPATFGTALGQQYPENIKLAEGQKYGEAELIEDLQIALKKSTALEKPVRVVVPVGY